MINDLPEVVHESTCLLFAVDLKLVLEVGDTSDHIKLQRDINIARAFRGTTRTYHIEGELVRRVSGVKDLGSRFTADLNFQEHTYSRGMQKKHTETLTSYYGNRSALPTLMLSGHYMKPN
ncbi:unnamed protein product [Euphydryas editha]|uniref:Uncharacterized protein n=1 Tax=Euphydryas editha TaxID=104508 RepID=A0AAU9TXD9_EUPED|nr:unnamed protein product [Euphydryas editha]